MCVEYNYCHPFGHRPNLQLKGIRKRENRGRKMTSLVSAHMLGPSGRVDQLPKIQVGSKFHDAVKQVTNKPEVKLKISPWLLTENTIRTLHTCFKSEYNSTLSARNVCMQGASACTMGS